MVDIHSHVLPGLDDGAPDMESGLEMLRVAGESGSTDIVATPHANPQYRFDPMSVEVALAALQKASGSGPRIHYGCELHLSPENIEDALRTPWKYTIGHRGYLLVEFDTQFVPKTSAGILRRLRLAGARPIIAHPERNHVIRERITEVAGWVDDGCLLQITAQSLLGQFGRSAEAASFEFIEQGLAHCVASDAHDPRRRPPSLDSARRVVTEAFGAETADRLFEENPRVVLNGGPVARGRIAVRRKARLWSMPSCLVAGLFRNRSGLAKRAQRIAQNDRLPA